MLRHKLHKNVARITWPLLVHGFDAPVVLSQLNEDQPSIRKGNGISFECTLAQNDVR